jgi:hypothetical protein
VQVLLLLVFLWLALVGALQHLQQDDRRGMEMVRSCKCGEAAAPNSSQQA